MRTRPLPHRLLARATCATTCRYSGAHWSKHKALYEKHLPEYKAARATMFYAENLFVIFGCIVAKDYDKLAELYFERPKDMSKEELAAMLRDRLRTCGPEIAKACGRTHK